MDDRYFDPAAPMGVPVRYKHECSKRGDRTLSVTRMAFGWIYKCHRCGDHGLRSLAGESGSIIAKFICDTAVTQTKTQITLPPGHEPSAQLKAKAQIWLDSYQITDLEIKRYGIYWTRDRLVFPVYQYGSPIYWQARGFNADKSKWINQKLVGRNQIYFYPTPRPTTDTVVLVEDMISAIKVNRVVDTIGLLGSYIGDDLIINLAKQYRRVVIWLDADKGEYSLAKVIRYRSFGLSVDRIFTPVDPKNYTEQTIKQFIKEN